MKCPVEYIIDYDEYVRLCECFFSLAKNNDEIAILKKILYLGEIDNYNFSSQFPHKDNYSTERIRRISLAYLFINNPETFNYFANNKINIFHGTTANALPNILKYGMNSVNDLNEKGIPILTGEEWSRIGGKRRFISFTDVLDVARDYASMSSKNGKEKMSFPVVIGTSDSALNNVKTMTPHSDLPEIAVIGNFPVELINCICVPEDKYKFVKKMVNRYNIEVLKMNNYELKFYYFDEMGGIEVFQDLLEKFKHNKTKSKKFATSEFEEMSKSRLIPNLKKIINDFEKISSLKSEENSNGKRI